MLFQSKTAKRRTTPPVAYQAGAMMVAVFEYAFVQAFTAATDIIEIGALPAGAKLHGATLLGTGLDALNTADVGLMTGEAGDYDETRTSGEQLFNAVAAQAASEIDATRRTCLAITPADTHRGIGVTLTVNEAASSAKKLTLVIEYTY